MIDITISLEWYDTSYYIIWYNIVGDICILKMALNSYRFDSNNNCNIGSCSLFDSFFKLKSALSVVQTLMNKFLLR